MRIGTLCFATERGLGYLARSFYDAGVVTDVMVLHHGKIPTFPQWYPGCIEITDMRRQRGQMLSFVERMDAMIYFETAFEWSLIDFARQRGKKSILMVMYECTPHPLPYVPDLYFCPSLLDMQYYPDNSVYIPPPVNKPTYWKQRHKAKTFLHNAGYIGLRGRHGTKELLEAIPMVRSPARFIIRAQTPRLKNLVPDSVWRDPRVTIRVGSFPKHTLYDEGDVFIDPEKFNGMSYPLQEARAAGMLIMTTNRFPSNHIYPAEYAIPVAGYVKASVGSRCREFDEAIVEPAAIAETIDKWYGADIYDYSRDGRKWAEEHSWDVLKPQYVEAIERCLTQNS